jgi:predicted DNA-binding protein
MQVVDMSQESLTFDFMETLSIKISTEDKARLKSLAAEQSISLSALLRQGLEKAVSASSTDGEVSCYSLAARYLESEGGVGASEIGDLSVNKAHMQGFGK